jgi:hypothetical protein
MYVTGTAVSKSLTLLSITCQEDLDRPEKERAAC